jgi:hypothetical protein
MAYMVTIISAVRCASRWQQEEDHSLCLLIPVHEIYERGIHDHQHLGIRTWISMAKEVVQSSMPADTSIRVIRDRRK